MPLTMVSVQIPEGEYEHPLGTLRIRVGIQFNIISLRLREPIGDIATAEWYFNRDGTYDGTGSDILQPVERKVLSERHYPEGGAAV